jgi:uncharacterized membrane protein YbhN (UPF0104 family)
MKMAPPDLVALSDQQPVTERRGPLAPTNLRIPTWLVGAGCAAFLVSWGVQGLSLGMTLAAVGEPIRWHDWPMWSGAMGLSTSLGFAVLFAPAGLGVREGVLLGTLMQAGIDARVAVAATVLSRFVSFFSDVLVAAFAYPTLRNRMISPGPSDRR